MIVWVAVYLVYTLVIVLAAERYMGVFFEKRRTSLPVMICTYFIFVALCEIPILFDSFFLSVVMSFAALFILTLNFESSMKKRITAVIPALLLSFTFQTISITILPINPLNFSERIETVIYAFAIHAIPLYIVISLLRKFKNIRKNSVTSTVFWLPIMLISILSFIMLVLLISNSALVNHDFTEVEFIIPQYVIFVAAIVILSINIITFYFQDALLAAYENKLKLTLNAQEKEYYFSQCQLMQESVEQVKSIRHDMKAHLSVLKDFTLDNTQATDYLNNLLGNIGESEIYSDTGNVAFDSIINFKLKNALEDGIKADANILIPSILNIEVADVVTILGNLIDNALEATAKVHNKKIKLDVTFDKGVLLINIENTFDGKIKYTDEEKRLIASLKNNDDHGFGLKNICKSVEKYNGHMDIRHDNNIFNVGVLLYLDA